MAIYADFGTHGQLDSLKKSPSKQALWHWSQMGGDFDLPALGIKVPTPKPFNPPAQNVPTPSPTPPLHGEGKQVQGIPQMVATTALNRGDKIEVTHTSVYRVSNVLKNPAGEVIKIFTDGGFEVNPKETAMVKRVYVSQVKAEPAVAKPSAAEVFPKRPDLRNNLTPQPPLHAVEGGMKADPPVPTNRTATPPLAPPEPEPEVDITEQPTEPVEVPAAVVLDAENESSPSAMPLTMALEVAVGGRTQPNQTIIMPGDAEPRRKWLTYEDVERKYGIEMADKWAAHNAPIVNKMQEMGWIPQ